MITDAILNAVHGLVSFFIGLLPEWSPPNFASMGAITDAVQFANAFVPISEMFTVLSTLAVAAATWLGAWIIIRVIDWLPFT